jgi:peptidoglycan glycosyltransferase
MRRRIRWLGVFMVLCFGLIAVQLVNIQFVKAHQLADSPNNPRVAALKYDNPRGTIYAADGTTVLAKSDATGPGPYKYPYSHIRQYPQGPLYAGITGYDSPLYYGTAGIEEEYNAQLSAHSQGAQNLSQLIFGEKIPSITDDVTLTVQPSLQQAAWNALTTLPPGANKDGAVVVLQPSTGDVEAMVSNPTYDPNALISPNLSAEQQAYLGDNTKDHEGFFPLQPIATGYRFAPGSTFKVITSTAAYNLVPRLANFDYPVQQCQTFTDSNMPLCDQGGACGGTMESMLPASCDPGYGELGVQEGAPVLQKQAELFGYNAVPGIDLPGVVASVFPALPGNSDALLAYSAIGQYNVAATALQNAMVASGIADGGVVMTPHLMAQIRDSQGDLVETYVPKPLPRTATPQAAAQVTALMEGVVKDGTAAGVGFPSYLCAAVKTGTAQTSPSQHVTETWMIGFAPANDPRVAVAVVVPEQSIASDGASVAGPIMKAVLEAAVPPGSITSSCALPRLPVPGAPPT